MGCYGSVGPQQGWQEDLSQESRRDRKGLIQEVLLG